MKIIDEKHYAEGGPKCWECRGTGQGKISGGGFKGGWQGHEDGTGEYLEPVPYWEKAVNCPVCHGTGLKPVEEWTAMQKADFIAARWGCWELHLGRELHTGKPTYHVTGDEPFLGNPCCADNLEDALTEAIIFLAEQNAAVKREAKERTK